MSARDLFTEIAAEYPSFSALEERIVAAYREHFAEFPTFFAMSELMDIARAHGWIQASGDSVRVSINAGDAA